MDPTISLATFHNKGLCKVLFSQILSPESLWSCPFALATLCSGVLCPGAEGWTAEEIFSRLFRAVFLFRKGRLPLGGTCVWPSPRTSQCHLGRWHHSQYLSSPSAISTRFHIYLRSEEYQQKSKPVVQMRSVRKLQRNASCLRVLYLLCPDTSIDTFCLLLVNLHRCVWRYLQLDHPT